MESTEASGGMSLGGRLINVFAAPGELFSAVAASGFSVANWLVPAGLVGLIGLIVNLVVFSHPALVQQIREVQDKEFQRSVEKGKMSAQDAEKAKEIMGGIGMTIAKVAGAIGALVVGVVAPLWWGFIGWVAARLVFRAPLPFLRAVEVAGLATLIGGLGMLAGLFLAVGTGNLMAGPHLGLVISDFDLTNRLHLAAAAINVFSLWQLSILSLGISRLIERPFPPVATVLFGVWAVYKAAAIMMRLYQFAL